ncbi:unnamed protein product [Hymenolepis diminuta]|uniref:Uncharacterized protein n=1 Tax=Hymenolepis diminuta TaxID=6216 RepID=A0A564ZBS7_HYMDI|nr:unnamed protein product [Hymenolepis diminuta]
MSDMRQSVCLDKGAHEGIIICVLQFDGTVVGKGRDSVDRTDPETSPSQLCLSNYHSRYAYLAFPIDEDGPLEDTRCLPVESMGSQ